jgi:hypothetical protein
MAYGRTPGAACRQCTSAFSTISTTPTTLTASACSTATGDASAGELGRPEAVEANGGRSRPCCNGERRVAVHRVDDREQEEHCRKADAERNRHRIVGDLTELLSPDAPPGARLDADHLAIDLRQCDRERRHEQAAGETAVAGGCSPRATTRARPMIVP